MSKSESTNNDDSSMTEKPEVNRVSIKSPPFWTDRKETLFFQVEAQVKINEIKKERN